MDSTSDQATISGARSFIRQLSFSGAAGTVQWRSQCEERRDCDPYSSSDQKLKHATLKSVNLKHPDVNIQLDQSLSLPFQYNSLTQPEVSIRYKLMNRDISALDLTGILTTISGKLHFEGGKTKPFRVVVPISGLYQEQVEN